MKTSYPSFKPSSFGGVVGVSQIDITPPVEIYSRNWGAAKYDTAEGIHRPLKLTCITFQSSEKEKPLVILSADFCVWRGSDDRKLMIDEILKALSLQPQNLMFCLSHTHSAPSLCREDASKPGGEYIHDYLLHVQECAIQAIKNALSGAVTATLTWHYGKCNLASNRDQYIAESNTYAVGFNPGVTADDTLLTGRLTDDDHKIIGTIVNYACHPTTLAWDNRLISPDYIGAMRELVEGQTRAPCLFLQGSSGELSPAEQYSGDTALADKHGRQLGYSVLSTLEAMLPPREFLCFDKVVESGAPLAVWEHNDYTPSTECSAKLIQVPFLLKPLPSLAEIEKQYSECEDRIEKERLWRKRNIRKSLGDGDTVNMPLWIWRLGDSFLIGQRNEAYSYFQQELRRQLSPNAVAVMNLVNGNASYLPLRELYDKDIYQVWHSPFAQGSLESLTEHAIRSARIIN